MASSNSESLFDIAVKTPKGQRTGTYATATCRCGRTEDIFAKGTAGGSTLPVEPLRRKFIERGWKVSGKKGRHTCPACQANPSAARAEPPPQPKPEDRRAILEALEIVFCPEKGFDAGYDDARVAEEHGVPRRWVEDIREQFIGPVPPPKVDHIAEARTLLLTLSTVAVQLADAIEQANAARSRIVAIQKEISKHLDQAGTGK